MSGVSDEEVDYTEFQSRFKEDEEFYTGDYVRGQIAELFPQKDGKPFSGLWYIQLHDEDWIEESPQRTQRKDIDRLELLLERIPNPEDLAENSRIMIVEDKEYGRENVGGSRSRYAMELTATDLGYIASCMWRPF